MTRPAVWVLAALISLVTHAVLAAVLYLSVEPDPVEPQTSGETKLTVSAVGVERSQAAPRPLDGDAASEAQPDAPMAGSGAIPQSNATSAPIGAERAAARPARGQDATQASTAATPIASVAAKSQAVSSAVPDGIKAQTADLPAPAVVASVAALGDQAAQTAPASAMATAVTPAAAPATASEIALQVAAPVTGAADPAPQGQPDETVVSRLETNGTDAPLQVPESQRAEPGVAVVAAAESVAPPADKGTASLAWTGNAASVDPVSLAAIQAFMRPGDVPGGAAVRDGIAGLLAAVSCARLQTAFIPETGALELRGHVPAEGLRAPILAALQAEVGTSLPVTDNMLILPRPLCGALTGIADVGLPQSTDQLTNPLLIGADAHAREYRFQGGDKLALELTAPEYAAFVYVDYFDAAGQVLHLVPNEIIALKRAEADAPLTVGAPELDITIAPPYGQEIVVAFASSVPLFDELRPIQEPAEPYLADLRQRVAAKRAAHQDFKGEWVYFFVSTRPPGGN